MTRRTISRLLWRIRGRRPSARLHSVSAEAALLAEAVDRLTADRERLRTVLAEVLTHFDTTGAQVSKVDPDTVLRWRRTRESTDRAAEGRRDA